MKLLALLFLSLMELTIPQTAALDYLEDDTTNEVLFGGSAGPGKTTLGCYFELKSALKYPGTKGLIGRSTLKTLMETTLVSFHKVAKLQGLQLGTHYRMHGQYTIKYPNGSETLLKDLFYYPSDPDCDELGSLEISRLFIDEASQVNARVKNVAKSRVRLLPDEYNLVPKSLYTTNPGKNWTKTEFRDKSIKRILEANKKYVPAHLDTNPFISKHYEANLKDLPKELRARLLDGNWDYADDPRQLCTSDSISSVFTNNWVLEGKKYITADIARFGKDRIIIRVWSGWKVLTRIELRGLKITETADRIKAIADKYSVPKHQIICDEDGLGGGVVDILGCKGFVAASSPIPVPGQNFGILKDQCGFHLADRINANELYDTTTDQSVIDSIVEELAQLKDATKDIDRKKRLLAKEFIMQEIGRSPDDLDTFIMRSWFDLTTQKGINIL